MRRSDQDPTPRRLPVPSRDAALRWAERTFLAIGLSCLVVVASTWIGAARYQAAATQHLEASLPAASVATPAAVPAAQSRPVPRRPIPTGSPLAILEVPRLELEAAVAEGASPAVLRRALGHLPASARPDEAGNLVIAGHRDTFFRPLEDIRAGDRIVLRSPDGRHEYRVQWTRVVEPTAVEVAADTGRRALTLITCYPFRWVGSAPLRFVVRALPTEAGVGPTS